MGPKSGCRRYGVHCPPCTNPYPDAGSQTDAPRSLNRADKKDLSCCRFRMISRRDAGSMHHPNEFIEFVEFIEFFGLSDRGSVVS